MKKVYLSALAIGLVAGVNAQAEMQTKFDLSAPSSKMTALPQAPFQEKATVIWSEDFSTTSNWTMDNSNSTDPNPEDWVITTNMADMPQAANTLYPFASATAANGFALINSDGAVGNADNNGFIEATMTSSNIDLQGYPNVILRFSHNYRWWHDTRQVRVSGDGGTTWTTYDMTSDNGGVFQNGYPGDQNSLNPQVEMINISAVAGNSANVQIQFYYHDNDYWAWYWVVDDVEILEQPADDVVNMASYIAGANNDGTEYGTYPFSQLDDSWSVGSQVNNFGTQDQTNVTVNADFGSFTSTSSVANIPAGDTVAVEGTETPTLAIGDYTGTFVVTSDNDNASGSEFANNSYVRTFKVSADKYALDAIGVGPDQYQNIGTMGTGMFTDGDDAFVMASWYHIKEEVGVSSLEIGLSAGVGGEVYAKLIDTAAFFAGDITGIATSEAYIITEQDSINQIATIPFDANTTLAPGIYFAAIECNSNGGSNIRIWDDKTVAQPNAASMIFIGGGATANDQGPFTNGEALAIRLNTYDNVGLNEVNLDGVSIYPNPTSGIINISNKNQTNNTIEVRDLTGKVIATTSASTATTIDLTGNAAGVYIVKVSNENGYKIEKVTLK